ncbi:alkaline phosphatase family protein [Pseudomonas kilonensis]|uniref:alkaline phosphatase family protein n=1 Tax=Pseudomonas kilonensis TaxID=132476 RepID=UPI003392DEBB
MKISTQNASHAPKSGLTQLSHAILASLGIPTFDSGFDLQPTNGLVIFIVDGLGQLLLDEHQFHAPFLKTLLSTGRSFGVGFPATTATSLASFALGQGSGQHGIVGSRFALNNRTAFSPLSWQMSSIGRTQTSGTHSAELPILAIEKTAWETAGELGLNIECILPLKIANSRYSKAIYKGVTITPYMDYWHCGFKIRGALKKSSRRLIYVYLGELDYAGHVYGTDSEAWFDSLRQVDTLIASTASALARGTKLLVAADHGMTTLSSEATFDFDTDPGLQEDVAWIAGDIRARHIYTEAGKTSAVLERWKNKLGDDFMVLPRSQAINEGLFGGAVRVSFEQRLGDLIVYPTGRGGIVQSLTEKNQTSWKGHHGALTEEDQLSPLLIYSKG